MLSTAFFSASAFGQVITQQPAGDQEPAAETTSEGEAKAEGEAAVPTSDELVEKDNRSLEEIIVIGNRTYRNRTNTIAPELTYDKEFFQKFSGNTDSSSPTPRLKQPRGLYSAAAAAAAAAAAKAGAADGAAEAGAAPGTSGSTGSSRYLYEGQLDSLVLKWSEINICNRNYYNNEQVGRRPWVYHGPVCLVTRFPWEG